MLPWVRAFVQRRLDIGQQIYIGNETNISKLGHFVHAQVNVSIASPSAPVISSAVIKPGMWAGCVSLSVGVTSNRAVWLQARRCQWSSPCHTPQHLVTRLSTLPPRHLATQLNTLSAPSAPRHSPHHLVTSTPFSDTFQLFLLGTLVHAVRPQVKRKTEMEMLRNAGDCHMLTTHVSVLVTLYCLCGWLLFDRVNVTTVCICNIYIWILFNYIWLNTIHRYYRHT